MVITKNTSFYGSIFSGQYHSITVPYLFMYTESYTNLATYSVVKTHYNCYCCYYFCKRGGGDSDSVVDIVIRCGLDGSVIESRYGRGFPLPSSPALGPT
jgi:hypothetical protein